MVCAQDEAARCRDQLPWFLNFFGLRSAGFYIKWRSVGGIENAAGGLGLGFFPVQTETSRKPTVLRVS